jgi:hypothetical protein
MTTVLRVNLNDLSNQFIQDLRNRFEKTAQIEIRVEEQKQGEGLLSEEQFWQILNLLDWKQQDSDAIMAKAVQALAKMPVANIYLFKDTLSEKLYRLDTRAHANAYKAKQEDGYLSVDDFLYVRCAVVAEGKDYYDKVLNDPSELPIEISFEPLLSLADDAYALKTGKKMDYFPTFNYETHSNQEGWL